jgi:hypothetical protein
MMNIIEFLNRNKIKSNNKIRILDILGFEPDISYDSYNYEFEQESLVDDSKLSFEELINVNEGLIARETTKNVTVEDILQPESIEETPTDTFNPINITQQIQRVWSDLESRRKWVRPLLIGTFAVLIIITSASVFSNVRTNEAEINQEAIAVTGNSNELIELLPTLIEISSNTFYSKYDVSNASANLQQIESSLIQYQENLTFRDDVNINDVQNNLNNIFQLVNLLDLVISYRILNSEVLIYSELPTDSENIDIGSITLELSDIIAKSKVNFEELPDIEEFQNHKNLVNIAIATAEDLHGRYLGALRNNEYEVASSITTAILLNKETELNAFKNSLDEFKVNALITYESFSDLP